jgi:TRAP-type C4-dicarboxylate transport system permease small subunit
MSAVIALYFRGLRAVIAILLMAMVVMVFGNVVLRYVFNSGLSFYDELSRWCFVWLTFLGAIVAMRERRHLGVDILVRLLPRLGRTACFIVSHLLMLYATWLLLTGSWMQTLLNWDVPGAATGLSSGLFYGVGVVFAGSAIVLLLSDLLRVLTGRLSADELIDVEGSEEQASPPR